MNDQELESKSHRLPFVIGGFLTVLLLGVYGVVLFTVESCDQNGICRSGLSRIMYLSPNELGDTVAGIASALAFIWIIVTVTLQSLELRAQRMELRLAIEEYRRMAKAQEEQLSLMIVQGKIFEDEQRQRQEIRSKDQLDALLDSVVSSIFSLSRREDELQYEYDRARDGGWPPQPLLIIPRQLSSTGDNLVKDLQEFVLTFHRDLLLNHRDREPRGFFQLKAIWKEIIRSLHEALDLEEQLDAAQKIRLQRLHLRGTISSIENILDLPIWESGK